MPSLKRLEYLAIGWLVLTVSMASWWLIFGLHQIDRLHEVLPQMASDLNSQRQMLIWEGLAWIVLLICGGIWLLTLIFREKQRHRQVREFFAVFNHELKTSLSSLRLQAECLQEELAGQSPKYLDRLVHDTMRLQLQLENSLMMSGESKMKAVMGKVDVAKVLKKLEERWPQIRFQVSFSSALVLGDEKLLESVLSNLIHNAVQHGKATEIEFKLDSDGPGETGSLVIGFSDNGKGYKGSVKDLGVLFQRATSTSGTGIGLYIVKVMMAAMAGRFEVLTSDKGFCGRLILRKA